MPRATQIDLDNEDKNRLDTPDLKSLDLSLKRNCQGSEDEVNCCMSSFKRVRILCDSVQSEAPPTSRPTILSNLGLSTDDDT